MAFGSGSFSPLRQVVATWEMVYVHTVPPPSDPIFHATENPQVRVVVYHEGACPLCAREITLMRRLDRRRRIRFVDAADPSATCPIDRTALLARFHAVEDGVLYSGAAAFAAMWRAIPLLRPLGLAARWKPLERLLEALYCRFLPYRTRLQALLR